MCEFKKNKQKYVDITQLIETLEFAIIIIFLNFNLKKIKR